jgi:hypothetical protein
MQHPELHNSFLLYQVQRVEKQEQEMSVLRRVQPADTDSNELLIVKIILFLGLSLLKLDP